MLISVLGSCVAMPITSAADRLLEAIARPGMIDGRSVAVVVAHPDDETIGCGALLQRMIGTTIVIVTDGAAEADAAAYGFPSTKAYAAARSKEVHAALGGVEAGAIIELGYGDQSAAFHLTELSAELRRIFADRGISVVLTHAYEGGHPDHDAVAFAVHRAASAIIEMPFYRQGERGIAFQSFAETADVVTMTLDADMRTAKAKMLAAHASQAAVLADFTLAREQFRRAPVYDFRNLPNRGAVEYDHRPWGLTVSQWRRQVETALSDPQWR